MATKSVIRVYTTEASALSGGSSGMVADSNDDQFHDALPGADSGTEAAVANTEVPYHIFERFYYRIEANEPVLEFHIDWDDGDDSSEEKRNIQIVKFEEPTTYCVIDHVYTFSRKFYPLIRVKSVDGFLSKWYTHHENIANDRLKPLLKLPPAVASHDTTGQQSFSRLSLNKVNTTTIPLFIPSNVPPVCIVKSDRKTMFAGIANHILTQNFESGTQYPLLYAYRNSNDITGPDIKLTVETDDKHVREYVIKGTNIVTNTFWTDKTNSPPASGNYLTRTNSASELAKMAVPFDNYNGNGTNEVIRLLRAELLNVDVIGDDERIEIKCFNSGTSYESKHMSIDNNRTVCVLSNGNPIVDMTDPAYSSNIDLSESFAKDSNSSIQKYLIDDDTIGCYNYRGGLLFSNTSPTTEGNTFAYASTFKDLQVASATTKGVALRDPTDILKGTELSMYDRGTNPKLNVAYTHDLNGHKKDDDGRYLDFYRLIRGQVQDNTSAIWDDNKGNDYSLIRHYRRAGQYESTLATVAGSVRIPTQFGSQGLLMLSNASGSTGGVADASWSNIGALSATSAHVFNDGGIGGTTYKLQDGGTTTTNNNTTTNIPQNYVLVCQTEIFDKLYFRTNNNNKGRSDSTAVNDIDITAWYTTSDGWKPLKVKDNTNGFSNSGTLTFKRPVDWIKRKESQMGGEDVGPVKMDNSGDEIDPTALWDFESYSVLIGINVNSTTSFNTQVISIIPYGDESTQLIKIVDPHHVSLNSIAIAQSISFNRQGKFQNVTDRFGKSEIRKMGVMGGRVRFGSVDLGDTDAQGNRKKIKSFQQNATPVFIDVTHKSGERTRFFGVITSMSEDHPTGKQNPKYGVDMQVSYLLELDASGNLLSDKISIGGKTDEARKFFVST